MLWIDQSDAHERIDGKRQAGEVTREQVEGLLLVGHSRAEVGSLIRQQCEAESEVRQPLRSA